MPHVLAQIQLKYDLASVPRFVEIMSHARNGFANAGWALVGSWATSVGAVHEVWDLWEVENYEAAQANFVAEMENNPEFAEWMGRLSEVVDSENTRLLTKLL